MKFRTEIAIPAATCPIQHYEKVMMLGSCFSENISQKLQKGGFRCISNPFGVLYNPTSISTCIRRLLQEKRFDESDLISYGRMHHSMLHHGSFSAADPEECLEHINRSLEAGRQALMEADIVIITWGTAWVYEMEGKTVANCHKIPAERFTRRRLSAKEIADDYEQLFALPELKHKRIILTVSPIRHIKDGLHENQLSKATLLLAADQLATNEKVCYFPSYELLLDELRDYRFYAEDMLHPSEVATDYIWEQFAASQLSQEAQQAAAECMAYNRSKAHRPLHPDDPAYKKFAETLEQKKTELLKRYPYAEL